MDVKGEPHTEKQEQNGVGSPPNTILDPYPGILPAWPESGEGRQPLLDHARPHVLNMGRVPCPRDPILMKKRTQWLLGSVGGRLIII